MSNYSLAFLGFGHVGRALACLLLQKRQLLLEEYGIRFTVTGIATGRSGQWADPQGIDLEQALAWLANGRMLPQSAARPIPDFLKASAAQVLFETIPVNYATGQPAVDYLRAAIGLGMHAISANKGPVVHAYDELRQLARARGVRYYFESAVMDGAPIFSLVRETLPAAEIRGFQGILNSTTNLILQRMEAGESFDDAVAYAQAIGLAETDPMGDLEGWDAAVKVAALSTVVLKAPLKPQQVERTGILGITPRDIELARQEGKHWKLICSARREGATIRARVAPQMVGVESPLYGVSGASSVITFEMDVLPGLTILETDPSPQTTAYGMLADLINAVRSP